MQEQDWGLAIKLLNEMETIVDRIAKLNSSIPEEGWLDIQDETWV